MASAKDVKTFQPFYTRFSQAFEKGDWSGVKSLVAKNFEAKGPQGKMLKWDEIERDFARQRKMMQTVKWQRHVVSADVKGSEATVVVDGHLSAGMTGPDQKPHKIEFMSTSKDTWVKEAGSWKLRRAEVIKRHMTMDGKSR